MIYYKTLTVNYLLVLPSVSFLSLKKSVADT